MWWWSLVVVVRVEGGGGGGGDEGHCGGGKRVPGVPHAELFLLAIYKLGCTSRRFVISACVGGKRQYSCASCAISPTAFVRKSCSSSLFRADR